MGEMADYYAEREFDIMLDEPNPGYYPDGILAPPPRPRRANSWGAHPEYTPQKGNRMALTPRQKVRKLEAELDGNLQLQAKLIEEEKKLRDDIRKADIPNQPPPKVGDWFKVVVQFSARGPHYTYLLARNANRWYTTGVSEEQKRFDSWSALAGWLNSTYWHSDLQLLEEAGRTFPTMHHSEPPF